MKNFRLILAHGPSPSAAFRLNDPTPQQPMVCFHFYLNKQFVL
jgi:hypothetical protein